MVDINIYVNELLIEVEKDISLYDVKYNHFPNSDISIVNGHEIRKNIPLKEFDRVIFIKKNYIPTKNELSYLIRARHTPGVHDKVKNSRIAIAGLGGLGSNVATALARIGCGYLRLIDYDLVEPSNINRQHYSLSHIGASKAYALQEQISNINPYIEIDAVCSKVTTNNAERLFKDVDIIVEAFDDPQTKASIVETLLITFPQKPIVASSGMAGYYSNNLIKTRKQMKNLYVIGDMTNEAKEFDGLMAPRVMIAAGHQANTVLRIIMNEREV